jgi:membrane associated rhomboid family serine protease
MVPLGLGVPVHRVPIITLAIVAICTFKYFAIDIHVIGNYEKEAKAIQVSIKKTDSYKKLKLEFCTLNAEKNIDCKAFSSEPNEKRQKEKKSNLSSWPELERKFRHAINDQSKDITNLQNFPAYDEQKKKLNRKLNAFFESNNLLTKKNQDIKAYFLCMFTHASFLHLLGNMLALIAFGIYVEAKIGHLAMIGSYAFTGLVSFYSYINFFSDSMNPLVGASGAIAGIMGMFYLSFYSHYLKFWLYFKTFLLPVKIYFPLLYVMTDILKHIEGTSNVASMAHITGTLTGMGIMIAFSRVLKTPYPFIYADELNFYTKIKNKLINNKDVELTIYWLKRNPLNYVLREKLITSLWSSAESDKVLSKNDRAILRENTRKYIGRSLFFNKGKSVLKTIELIPLKYSLAYFLEDFQNKDLIRIYNLCLKKGAITSSVRMACILLERQKDIQLNKTLMDNIKSSSINQDTDSLRLIFEQCQNNQLRAELISLLPEDIIKETA